MMSQFIQVAIEAATTAGKYTRKRLDHHGFVKEKKGPADIVTEADIGTQKLIINIIKKNFPNHKILAEEQNNDKKVNLDGYVWAIDPIDGTSAFAAGLPTYSCSIALLKDKTPIVGAIYVAFLSEVVWAAKGKGRYSENKKVITNNKKNLFEATVGFDPAYFSRDEHFKSIAAPLARKIRILPMIWSQAASLSLIAKGIFDGY